MIGADAEALQILWITLSSIEHHSAHTPPWWMGTLVFVTDFSCKNIVYLQPEYGFADFGPPESHLFWLS